MQGSKLIGWIGATVLSLPLWSAIAMPITLDLRVLDGSNGVVLNGAGFSVSGAGDVNGDQFDDVIVGTESGGSSYVVFGQSAPFGSVLTLADLDGGTGFAVNTSGAVSGAGDINHDNVADIIIGSPTEQSSTMPGRSYMVFGRQHPFAPVLDVSTLDGSNGFAMVGVSPGDGSGLAVSAAGDVNGDGIDDALVGAPFAEPASGEGYVIYGREGGFAAELPLSTLDGSNGFTLEAGGNISPGFFGLSVSGLGDVNGDGLADIAVDGFLKTAVLFGRQGNFSARVNAAVLDGSNGFVFSAAGTGEGLGDFGQVSGAGDFNGDGFDELLFGEPYGRLEAPYDDNIPYGVVTLLFGQPGSFTPLLVFPEDVDGVSGFSMVGLESFDASGTGWSVSGAGDFNGDGLDDLLVSAAFLERSYLIYGRRDPLSTIFELVDLKASQGLILDGAGFSVSGAGDFNGDGFDDVILGDGNRSYLVFGFATVPEPTGHWLYGVGAVLLWLGCRKRAGGGRV